MKNGRIEMEDAQSLRNIYNKIDGTGCTIVPLTIDEQILIFCLGKLIEDYVNDRTKQELTGTKLKEDDWIPCTERLPVEKTNPITQDWYAYPVTIEIDGERDVRFYKFGKGHWWHGPECMDKYVVAWKDVTKPYNSGKTKANGLYKYVYGNRYITNVEEGGIALNQEDLKSAALNFLDSLPDYQSDNFRAENRLPKDWYESIFGTCTEIDTPLKDCELGIHANYDIV